MKRRDALGLLAGSLVAGCAADAGSAISPPPAMPASLRRGALVQWCVAGAGVIRRGGGVATWLDYSGLGNHLTQAEPARRPHVTPDAVHGQPAISFDGLGQALDSPHLGEPRCEILVYRLRSGPVRGPVAFDALGADGTPGGPFGAYALSVLQGANARDRRLSFTRCDHAGRAAIRLSSQPVIGAWGIIALRNDGRSARLQKSVLRCGEAVPLDLAPPQPITRATVGCGLRDGALTNFAPIDIAEKISFADDLSDDAYVDVINDLRERYALGMSAASGDVVWPVFQANGIDERGLNDNLVLLQGDGERFFYRPSHYLPPDGFGVRDPSMAIWRDRALLAHTLWGRAGAPAAFALAASTDGLASFSAAAVVPVGAAVPDAAAARCWAPEFVRTRDNATYLLDDRPVILCNIAPAPPALSNGVPGMQYYLFTPADDDLAAPWRLLGGLAGLPPNVIDGFLFHDPDGSDWWLSVTPCNPPQSTQLYRAASMLGVYVPVGTGGFPGSHEGSSVLRLGDTERYFLDARGTGYAISDNRDGLAPEGWSSLRPVAAPFVPQHGTPLPSPQRLCTI